MATASNSYSMPKTPQSAPPNFYSQAGQMAAGQGGAAGAKAGASSASPSPQPGQGDPEADHTDFVQNAAKLLTVFQKMGETKPNGVDITKFTKAMTQILKDCLEQVSSGGAQAPGSSSSASEDGTSPEDAGSTGPPPASGGGGGGASAASGGM